MSASSDVQTEYGTEVFADVAGSLGPYLAAARSGSVEGLRECWHEAARIVGWVDGQFLTLDRDAFGDWVAANGPSPGIAHHIVSIDVSGPAAAVRVEFSDWLGFRFTDFFLLRRTDAHWEIVSKVYDSHGRSRRPDPAPMAADDAGYEDIAAIHGLIDDYVEGARAGDEGRLRAIWFDHARITGWRDGALVDLDADTFCRRVADAKGAPKVEARIASIDVSSVAASARIELRDWNGVRFTDFLTLCRGPDGWRVAGKVFDAHGRS
jgi:hypothetical protein